MHLVAKFFTCIVSHCRIARIEVNPTNENSHMFITARISLKYKHVLSDRRYLHLKKFSKFFSRRVGSRSQKLDFFLNRWGRGSRAKALHTSGSNVGSI